MERSKATLKSTRHFHLIDPSELDGLEDLAHWLEAILHNPCGLWEDDGEEFLIEVRQLVDRLNGLKIEIYPDEHPPPHFHVVSPGANASFTIEDCRLLKGKIDPQDQRKVRFWHKHAKATLIECWNSTRPTDCVVDLTPILGPVTTS